MRDETIALHSGFDADPATKAVAVPICRTAAYQFDSADQGAVRFNLEQEGNRYMAPETIRLSVGIEHRDDIIAGRDQALAAAMRGQFRMAR